MKTSLLLFSLTLLSLVGCVETSSESKPPVNDVSETDAGGADNDKQDTVTDLDSENPETVEPGTVNQNTLLLQNEIDVEKNVYVKDWACESEQIPSEWFRFFLNANGEGIFLGYLPTEQETAVSWAGLQNQAVYFSLIDFNEARIWRNIQFQNMFEFSADRYVNGEFRAKDTCVLTFSNGTAASNSSSSFLTRAFFVNGPDRNTIVTTWNCEWVARNHVITLFADGTGNILSDNPQSSFTISQWDATNLLLSMTIEHGAGTSVYHFTGLDKSDELVFTAIDSDITTTQGDETSSGELGAASCVKNSL